MRTRVYVDGFNLYYGALKGTTFKWLDLVKLADLLLPDGHRVDRLRYFTARVSGVSNAGAPARQHAYLRALGTLPEVRVHIGRFLAKTAWRPLTNLPVADRRIDTSAPVTLPAGNHPVEGGQTLPVGRYPVVRSGKKKRRKASKPAPDAVIAEVHVMEEKGSDVNLAAHLLNDAWKGLFDAAFEAGIYDGDYVVVREPLPSWRAELKEIRDAAFTKWPDRIVTLDDIAAWVENDAPDLLTGEKLLSASPLNEREYTPYFNLNSGMFRRLPQTNRRNSFFLCSACRAEIDCNANLRLVRVQHQESGASDKAFACAVPAMNSGTSIPW